MHSDLWEPLGAAKSKLWATVGAPLDISSSCPTALLAKVVNSVTLSFYPKP